MYRDHGSIRRPCLLRQNGWCCRLGFRSGVCESAGRSGAPASVWCITKEFEVGVAFATGGQYTNLPGGLPIVLDGIHIGGIGVSGGSGDDDLDVARAGLAAIGAA